MVSLCELQVGLGWRSLPACQTADWHRWEGWPALLSLSPASCIDPGASRSMLRFLPERVKRWWNFNTKLKHCAKSSMTCSNLKGTDLCVHRGTNTWWHYISFKFGPAGPLAFSKHQICLTLIKVSTALTVLQTSRAQPEDKYFILSLLNVWFYKPTQELFMFCWLI